ncbi:Pentatricopeptide repeat-containing protein [Striga hermonthica]|uniref:Pentatricopeptide repeat-containing protein n=1 Tax=Striga hermonthica TaxID=68872 RepID=A0A9N7MED9_STRHE|nr:Pentatricopeptide repeat-containing protein [Striga hermonthica]
MTPKKLRTNPCVIQNLLQLTSRGHLREAVDALPLASRQGFSVSPKIIAALIRQCAAKKSIKEGKLVHLHLKRTGSKHPGPFISNHLINMYASCGDHETARQVFDKMRDRNLYSWNNMLSGYANLGMTRAAKRLFDKMPEKDFVSWNTMAVAYLQCGWFNKALMCYVELRRSAIGYNEYSLGGALTACVKSRDLRLGKQFHCQVLVLGFLSSVILSSSLVDAYAKCGELGFARRLFDEMTERDIVAWTTLVSGYALSEDMGSAREIFDLMPEKNSVSWSALIAGYARNGMSCRSLELFKKMIELRLEPDQFAYNSCLFACASMASINHGKQFHSRLITSGIRPNVVVLSSLIDMYSKCGDLDMAKRVFHKIQDNNNQHATVLWNTMISSLAHHGRSKEAIGIFSGMLSLGVKPESLTFVVLLNACGRSGLVQEGLRLFESMKPYYHIAPGQEHYACLVSLLGPAGFFDELMNQLKIMPFYPDDRVWNALLTICKTHGRNMEFGRTMAKHLVGLDPQSPAAYLLLSGIYAAIGRWESAQEVERLAKLRYLKKQELVSWVEIDRVVRLGHEPNTLDRPQKETNIVLELLSDGGSDC